MIQDSPSSSPVVYLYEGRGAHLGSVNGVKTSLRQVMKFGSERIVTIDLSHVKSGRLKERGILILPGGGAWQMNVGFRRAKVVSKIRTFVSDGGNYLGFCAGGYLASQSALTRFRSPEGVEDVLWKPVFGLLPVMGKGPTYECVGKRGRAAVIRTELGCELDKGEICTYWNQGSSFEKFGRYRSVRVLARYSDVPGKPVAVVSGTYGKGIVVATGIHPEWVLSALPAGSSAYLQLKKHQPKNERLFQALCENVGLSVAEEAAEAIKTG